MKRLIPIKSLLMILCIGLTAITLAAGCTTVKEAQEKLNSLSYYVEYLVRGDTGTAGKILKKEGGSRYADLYKLFLPKLRSMEDKQPYFPVFIENRRKRFPQLREYKRAGLIGESSVGYVKIIISNPVTLEEPLKSDLEKLTIRENFDRERIIRFMLDSRRSLSKKKLIKSFTAVRHSMALTGDMIEIKNKKGKSTWIKAERK